MFCPQCGKKNDDSSNFCTVCGTKLTSVTNVNSISETNSSVHVGNTESVQNGWTSRELSVKGVAIFTLVATLIMFAILLIANSSANVDKRIVGKWRYNSNYQSVIEFEKDGDYIANEDTEYEENGTYTTEDGVIYVTIDGETEGKNYRVVDDDNIQIEVANYRGMYERYYEWIDLYRVY